MLLAWLIELKGNEKESKEKIFFSHSLPSQTIIMDSTTTLCYNACGDCCETYGLDFGVQFHTAERTFSIVIR